MFKQFSCKWKSVSSCFAWVKFKVTNFDNFLNRQSYSPSHFSVCSQTSDILSFVSASCTTMFAKFQIFFGIKRKYLEILTCVWITLAPLFLEATIVLGLRWMSGGCGEMIIVSVLQGSLIIAYGELKFSGLLNRVGGKNRLVW